MPIGQPDYLEYIDIHRLGDHRELVGEGDVDVAGSYFPRASPFRGPCGRGDTVARDEAAVEVAGALCTPLGHTADHSVVRNQFLDNLAGQDPLGTIGDVYVRAFAAAKARNPEVGTQPGQEGGDFGRGSDG